MRTRQRDEEEEIDRGEPAPRVKVVEKVIFDGDNDHFKATYRVVWLLLVRFMG